MLNKIQNAMLQRIYETVVDEDSTVPLHRMVANVHHQTTDDDGWLARMFRRPAPPTVYDIDIEALAHAVVAGITPLLRTAGPVDPDDLARRCAAETVRLIGSATPTES